MANPERFFQDKFGSRWIKANRYRLNKDSLPISHNRFSVQAGTLRLNSIYLLQFVFCYVLHMQKSGSCSDETRQYCHLDEDTCQ